MVVPLSLYLSSQVNAIVSLLCLLTRTGNGRLKGGEGDNRDCFAKMQSRRGRNVQECKWSRFALRSKVSGEK